jgi:hypothetical protein
MGKIWSGLVVTAVLWVLVEGLLLSHTVGALIAAVPR